MKGPISTHQLLNACTTIMSLAKQLSDTLPPTTLIVINNLRAKIWCGFLKMGAGDDRKQGVNLTRKVVSTAPKSNFQKIQKKNT